MDSSQSKSLHSRKQSEIVKRLSEKGYNCIKNMPIRLPNNPKTLKLDVFCWKEGKVVIAEIESNMENSQSILNKTKMEEAKRIFSKPLKVTACQYSLMDGGCK